MTQIQTNLGDVAARLKDDAQLEGGYLRAQGMHKEHERFNDAFVQTMAKLKTGLCAIKDARETLHELIRHGSVASYGNDKYTLLDITEKVPQGALDLLEGLGIKVVDFGSHNIGVDKTSMDRFHSQFSSFSTGKQLDDMVDAYDAAQREKNGPIWQARLDQAAKEVTEAQERASKDWRESLKIGTNSAQESMRK